MFTRVAGQPGSLWAGGDRAKFQLYRPLSGNTAQRGRKRTVPSRGPKSPEELGAIHDMTAKDYHSVKIPTTLISSLSCTLTMYMFMYVPQIHG
ncbi:hypothetical protein PDE_05088 [Penicillium oxalicum 114-2]|uniref:Uncharacterized protein n=1 Tax=Penicillium oxalicum (strain 114-2 / CGMCC 5302) TaxID=933388 RepID=S8AV77_PENO1|nr:hypothetical protein PDE_05088 [Penicillium oxalicum 114-2]